MEITKAKYQQFYKDAMVNYLEQYISSDLNHIWEQSAELAEEYLKDEGYSWNDSMTDLNIDEKANVIESWETEIQLGENLEVNWTSEVNDWQNGNYQPLNKFYEERKN